MPEGILVLMSLGGDAKASGLPDEYGQIAPLARRRHQETAKSQDLLGQEQRPAAAIAPARAPLEHPGIGAHVRQQDELTLEPAILSVIDNTAVPVIRAKGELSHGFSPTPAKMSPIPR